jgi:hypothetical protein
MIACNSQRQSASRIAVCAGAAWGDVGRCRGPHAEGDAYEGRSEVGPEQRLLSRIDAESHGEVAVGCVRPSLCIATSFLV